MLKQRFFLQTSARFLWQEADGTWRQGQGTTRDISRYGIFIATANRMSPGTQIQVIVDMPSRDGAVGQLCGKGVAIRGEERDGEPAGFAAEVLFQSGWASALAQLTRETVRADDHVPALEPWVIPNVNEVPFGAAL
jgi:hypothetical protein